MNRDATGRGSNGQLDVLVDLREAVNANWENGKAWIEADTENIR